MKSNNISTYIILISLVFLAIFLIQTTSINIKFSAQQEADDTTTHVEGTIDIIPFKR